jgi:ribosomal protein L11 methylase PrmA
MHLVLHGKKQKQHQASTQKVTLSFGLHRQRVLLEHLESTIAGLSLPNQKTTWCDYVTQTTHYSPDAKNEKRHIIQKAIDTLQPKTVWDFGGNVGVFSRLSAAKKIYTVCFDIDPLCVEINYREARKTNDEHLLPLVMDLANPTPAIGWHHRERHSLVERGPCDLGLALALIHHLRITANIPLRQIAEFFAHTTKQLMIEFIPKDDVMTQQLLINREDLFHDYTASEFERLFSEHFVLEHKETLPHTARVLYQMTRRT